ncbi:MAG TPA: universal stress protein [Anaeromyxobacteraceae bacterium]|nr:universal stress protein [Anaeromyxobacteraceae bacterium]
MRRILVGIDGSETSLRAARLAADIASQFGAQLTLAYAVPRLLLPPDAYGLTRSGQEEEGRAVANRVLVEATTMVGRPGLWVDTLVLHGRPAESLAEAAWASNVDLIVVGNRGRGMVSRMLLGSVTSKLVHISSKPVLVWH